MPRTRIERVTFALQVRRATTTPTRLPVFYLANLYVVIDVDLRSSARSELNARCQHMPGSDSKGKKRAREGEGPPSKKRFRLVNVLAFAFF